MKVSEFDYQLPEELIAQEPAERRDKSRLLVLFRENGEIRHHTFGDIVEFLEPGDLLVLNDTRVIPARLYGFRPERRAKVEVLLLKQVGPRTWEVLTRPGRKARVGQQLIFGDGELTGQVTALKPGGIRVIEFTYQGNFRSLLEKLGEVPTPPYIKNYTGDPERYQTVYAKREGSAAAPTAGLHFTRELLSRLKTKGIDIAEITLHVGLGTFRPVKVDRVEEHVMHSEWYEIPRETADKVSKCRREGGRVVAVGTTVTRTLESVAREDGTVQAGAGETDLFIYPGYTFRAVDVLLTNFHLPKSTLLMLVCAFAEKEQVMNAYRTAVRDRYRFFSLGDAMLIL